MSKRFFLMALLSMVLAATECGAAAVTDGCRNCGAHTAEIAELIKQADRLHAQFKPKEGAAKLQRVLQLDPRNVEALAKLSRAFASLWYGRSLPKGDLDQSVELLKKAVALNPAVIVSRLELAQTYVVREDWAAARELLKSIPDIPIQFSDDARHKRSAAELLESIKDR